MFDRLDAPAEATPTKLVSLDDRRGRARQPVFCEKLAIETVSLGSSKIQEPSCVLKGIRIGLSGVNIPGDGEIKLWFSPDAMADYTDVETHGHDLHRKLQAEAEEGETGAITVLFRQAKVLSHLGIAGERPTVEDVEEQVINFIRANRNEILREITRIIALHNANYKSNTPFCVDILPEKEGQMKGFSIFHPSRILPN